VGYGELSKVWITVQPLRKQKPSSKYFSPHYKHRTGKKRAQIQTKCLLGKVVLAAKVMNTDTMSIHDER